MVVGSPRAPVGPLCSEASRLGFELFRCRQLKREDRSRLHAAEWAAAVLVESEDFAPTLALFELNMPPSVPVIWIGDGPGPTSTDNVTRLPPASSPEALAATVFEHAQTHLYPQALVDEVEARFRRVMLGWGERGLHSGPVWVKNHFTPPFSMSAVVNLYGDVSGELVISGSREWFDNKREAMFKNVDPAHTRPVEAVPAEIANELLGRIKEYLEAEGADLSMGRPRIVTDGQPIPRSLSHRPAICLEFATRDDALLVVEFSGTGLDGIGAAVGEPHPEVADAEQDVIDFVGSALANDGGDA